MEYTVRDFPIFHRYFASILVKIGVEEKEYPEVFKIVGNYIVDDYCRCGDPLCSTVEMTTNSMQGRNEAFSNPFNMGWVIINFYPDGKMEIENLADRQELNFPFQQEIRDVLAGKTLDYDDAYAESVVQDFMVKLEKSKALKIEV